MIEKRKSPRQKSHPQSYVRILQTDTYVDCTVLDISETEARLGFAGPTGLIELHIPRLAKSYRRTLFGLMDTSLVSHSAGLYDLGETAQALMRFASQPE